VVDNGVSEVGERIYNGNAGARFFSFVAYDTGVLGLFCVS
jgi:hypothetical protein